MDSYLALVIGPLLCLVAMVVGGIGEFVIRRARRREAERIEAQTIRGIREYQEVSKSPNVG
jgi:hypothetical protein